MSALCPAHDARLVHHGGASLYRGTRPVANGCGTALDLVHVGHRRLLFGAGFDPNHHASKPALWHAALGHELSDGGFHHPHFETSLPVRLWLVGFTGYALLAITTALVLWLSLDTLKGLLSGALLSPEAG